MDNGGIWPGDESYFQNIRETALQDTIEQLTKELAEARAENAALVAEFQRLADEPPTLEEIAADLDKIEMLERELAEARAEIDALRMGKMSPCDYYTSKESEENLCRELAEARAELDMTMAEQAQIIQQLAEARAEIKRLKKNLRLLLCKKHLDKCENGLFNSRFPDDEPCLICVEEAAERGK